MRENSDIICPICKKPLKITSKATYHELLVDNGGAMIGAECNTCKYEFRAYDRCNRKRYELLVEDIKNTIDKYKKACVEVEE